MQEILVYIVLFIAVGFLLKKFFWKPKNNKNCGGGNCNCS